MGRTTCIWPALMFLATGAVALTLPSKPASKYPGAAAKYVEVREAAGLTFQYRNSPTPNKYLIETMGGGVAIFDYDNDGWMDVFFVNGAALANPQPNDEPPDKSAPEFWNRLFRNNGDGSFTDVTEIAGLQGRGYGMGVATGDYDNDGFVDLFVTNYGLSILYRNNGDGTLSDVTGRAGLKTDGWNMSAGFLDYDNDGDLDLFVTRYLQWDFSIGSMVCGFDIPGGRAYCHPNEFPAISNYLFCNNGDGTFTDVSKASGIRAHEGYGLGSCFADFNRDGFLDIYAANDAFPQFLFMNQGDGTFAELAALWGVAYTEDGNVWSGMGTDCSDLDNDGLPDIICTALPYEYWSFFHNSRDGFFTYASVTSNLAELSRPYGGWGVHVFDFDNDGINEMFVATAHVMDNIEVTQPHLAYMTSPILLRYQANRFVDISSESGGVFGQRWAARGAAFGDLDNDGDIDIVVSDYNSPAHLLRNEGKDGNSWIGLDLVGTQSNRDAIGARITLTTEDGRVQYRTVLTAGSYACANDRRAFFGLGSTSKTKEIRIQWPSGVEQVIDNPKPNQILHVVEEPTALPSAAKRDTRHAHSSWRSVSERRMASGFFRNVQVADAENAQAQYSTGLAYLRQGRITEATAVLRKAVQLKPEFVEARYALGVAYSRGDRDMLPSAVDQFLEVLRRKPDHIDARVDLSSILMLEGDSFAAAVQLEQAILLAPANADLRILLGQALYESRKYSEATQSFRKALDLNPRLAVAHYGIGLVLDKQREGTQAAEEFRAALGLNPNDAFSHYELGKLALAQGMTDEASAHLKEAVRLRPELAEGYVELAELRRRENKPAEAENMYRTALRYRPDLFDAVYNLARLLKAQGRTQEADEYFARVQSLQQARTATGRANALNAHGIKLTNQGRFDEALIAFRKALEIDSTFFMAAYNQGVVLARQGKNREAVEAFRKAVRLRPDFVMAHYGLGNLLRVMGDPAAGEELRKARLLSEFVAQPLGRNDLTTLEPLE